MSTILKYLVLPREISTFERTYLGRVNRIALYFFLAHIPVFATVAALDKQELYYVRVRSDVSLGGVNSWFARMTGEAEETPWVQSGLLTPVRNQ